MESGCSTFGFALGEEKKWNIDDNYLKYGFALEEFSLKKKENSVLQGGGFLEFLICFLQTPKIYSYILS